MKKLVQLLGYIAIVAGILVVGWRQPLKYLFMSEQEISTLEHPAPPPAAPSRGQWMWDPAHRSSLDQPPRM